MCCLPPWMVWVLMSLPLLLSYFQPPILVSRDGASPPSPPLSIHSLRLPHDPLPPTVAVIRKYLKGYSGSRVKTPKRRFCRMLQKSGGGMFVIPDAEGTGTFVTISCQSNHMNGKLA